MKILSWALVLLVAAGLASAAFAGDEGKSQTVTGKVVCAMCTLHKDDAKDCQNVLVVANEGATVEYYIVKNDVSEKFGHACSGARPAAVTGVVVKKDGKTWIEPSKMDEPAS